MTHVVPATQSTDGAPAKFGATKPGLAVAVSVAKVPPRTGPLFSILTVIPILLPLVEPISAVVEVTFAVSANQPQVARQAELLKLATWAVLGSGVVDPLAMVTQTPPRTLVELQPVWKPRAIPPAAVVPVTLKTPVKSRPVVGAVVRG